MTFYGRNFTTRKRGNCECIATWGRPSHASRSGFNYDAIPSLTSLNLLPYYSVFAADTLLYAVTLTFDLWPWTFSAYRLWRDKTLYQIWTQSNNPRRSHCDFSVWPYDLEHVLSVALGSGIIFTKFDLRQLIHAWIIAFLMLVRYVKMWPWLLTCLPWKFVLHQVSRDQSMYEIWAKSSKPRLNYWKFCEFLHTLCHVVTLSFDLLTLNFYSTSECHAFKVCTKFERNRIIHGWIIDDLARFRVHF